MARNRRSPNARHNSTPQDSDRRHRLNRSLLAAALAAGVAFLAIGLAAWWTGWADTTTDGARPEATDPRVTYETDYLNVRPDVKYVGDQACAACHESECSSFAHHPMKQTLQPLPKADAIEALNAAAGNPFQHDGFVYEVRRDGQGGGQGGMLHRETHSALGPAIAASREIKYAIGSGNHARSYLFEDDGHLFYSPITWYSQRHTWGLSPAFRRANKHFSLPVSRECLFCHTSRVEQTGPAVNQVRITEHGVGCERCHGPAELHVRRHEQTEANAGQDFTIVNPAKLAPTLRDAVCEQCHLEGLSNERIARRGRDLFDFRPGLPLHLFIASFARAAHVGRSVEFVGHVEQMRVSRCYLASDGKLSCISCHDPHTRPAPETKVEFYRQRCLNCHSSPHTECRETLERRKAKTARDDCAVCHMPSREATDVAHVAITDHRVPRVADKFELPKTAGPGRQGAAILVNLHEHLLGPDDPEARRDLGIALSRFTDEDDPHVLAAAQQAVPLLQAAVGRDDTDALAWEALGRALSRVGNNRGAAAALEKAIAAAPERESAWVYAADVATVEGRVADCIKQRLEANRLNPRSADYRFLLGDAYFLSGAWRKALEQFDGTLQINPLHQTARLLSGNAQLELKQWPAASEQFNVVLKMDPKNPGARLGMAELHIRQGDYRAAVPWLQQILADEPRQQDVRLKLIGCYNKFGDSRSAAEEAQRLGTGAGRGTGTGPR